MRRNDPDDHARNGSHGDWPDRLATGVGWFSLGLGLAEILAPQMITRAVGFEGREGLIRGYGAREIAAGMGILASQGSARSPGCGAAWVATCSTSRQWQPL